MTSSSDPEAAPNLDELIDGPMPPERQSSAEVIDFQKHAEEHGYGLLEGSAVVIPFIEPEPADSAERARLYALDLKRAEAALEDPDAFEAMVQDYRPLMRLIASGYFLQGGTGNDLVQEAMFGFYKSVRDYDGQSSSFRNFAELCMRRQVVTAVKTGARNKHEALNNSLRLSGPPPGSGDAGDLTLEDVLPAKGKLPENIIIDREELNALIGVINTKLSLFEHSCLTMFLDGKTYKAIAAELECEAKSVDNALQRVRLKVARHLDPE